MPRLKQKEQTKINLSTIITTVVSILALGISGISLYVSTKPDDTKLTIKSSKAKQCFNRGKECYKLFIYNNDKAPCFEFRLDYNKNSFKEIVLLKDYDKSNVFNAEIEGNSIVFPAMPTIPIDGNWLGYLDKTKIAYLAFFPNTNSKKEKKVTVSCIDYKEEIIFE